ncbi:DUF2169 domain-containing protein [Labrenzia sp. VG12]|uniref:DUF2169 family type VI secretion system accessory protein n=1 Tax=Labrenzia sp. VG12 TaxID=2021862 RepID=UPI000B8BBB1D|nr:DUF2169 domain-containing protein [Labrenzia sp. VG12]ASP33729.1 hypothetical protein CHH27_11110 [Labrenzia sp. VG12]
MPAIIKPSRISVAQQTELSRDGALTTVSAYALFDFSDPKRFLTEQALWPMVAEQMPNGAIFDKGQAKPKAELIIAGCALSPTEAPVEGVEVTARFGSFQKKLAVFGDRFWRLTDEGVQMSRPTPFLKMPIGDIQAFGGQGFAHNPRGKGYGASILVESGFDAPLPNVENPARLIKSIEDRPTPVHFGPIAADDPARITLLGTYDQHWIDKVSPLKPEDFNPLYHCEAPHDQRFDAFFNGGESFAISGMSRGETTVGGQLPYVTARCFYELVKDGSLHETGMRCDTVTLFPNVQKAVLTFRGLIRAEDRFAEDIASIMVAVEETGQTSRDHAYYADIHRKRRSKEDGHKYALADYQLMPEIDAAIWNERQQAKLDKAAADRQKFKDNQDWAIGKMLEDEGLPKDIFPEQQSGIADDLPLIAQPTREDLEKGELDVAALLDDVKAVEEALLEKRDREMVRAELQRRAVVAAAPSGRLPANLETPIVDDDLVQRYADVELDPDLVDGLNQLSSQLNALKTQRETSSDAGADATAGLEPSLDGLADLFGEPQGASQDDIEVAYDKAVARALRQPEGSILADLRQALSDMDLVGLDQLNTDTQATNDVQKAGASLDGLDKGALETQLDQTLSQTGSLPVAKDTFNDMLDALMGKAAEADTGAMQPAAGQSPSDAVPAAVDMTMARLEEADVTVDENMAMARHQSPTPLFPLDPLPEGVPVRLGTLIAEKLKAGHAFHGADLAGADLRGVDFSGLDLTDTFFERADLTGASFAGADLTGAVFTGATLDGTDFTRADLTHANLSRVRAKNMRLDRARLVDLMIFQANFSGTAGSNVELDKVRFIETTLDNVELTQSRITDCQFLSGSADGIGLPSSKILRTMFVMVPMTGLDLTGSDLERIGFVEVNAAGADGRNGKWLSVGFMGNCDLTGARFDRLDAKESSFNTAKMEECCFLRAKGDTCFFNACDLKGNDFRLAAFRNSMFGKSNFQGSDFFGANLFMAALTGADLRNCSMRAANLYAANLLDTKLAGCDLTGANLGLTLMEQQSHA